MAFAVTFEHDFTSQPTINNYGDTVAYPTLPSASRLYIIHNSAHVKSVYAGTSSDVKQRFKPRLEVYRESGISTNDLAKIKFHIIKVLIDDVKKSVTDKGCVTTSAGDLDVENLFIRALVVKKQCTLFNIAKWQSFINPFSNHVLDVEFDNFPNDTNAFIPGNFQIKKGAYLT